MKPLKEMRSIDIDEIFAFLDRMEILEKEHRKMRTALLKLSKTAVLSAQERSIVERGLAK